MATLHKLHSTGAGFAEEMRSVLERRVYATLATENADGSVQMAPLWFAFDGDRFLFESGSRTRKVRNLERRPRARVLVEAPYRSGWVSAAGPVTLAYGDEAQRLNEQVWSRYCTEAGQKVWADVAAPHDDVTIILTPEKWSSWSAAGLVATLIEGGYRAEDAGDWFLPLDP